MKKEIIVRKAVIPVAGLGTRMLPATKAIPKEMLPVVDKPLIQYVVKEAIAAGIKEIILVTHSSKNSIENHFDKSFEPEATLEKRVKRQLLAEVQNICPKDVTIMHIRQGEAKGLGHVILCAHPLVGDNLYFNKKSKVQNKKLGLERIFLFANKLSFKDKNGETKNFSLGAPKALDDFLKTLKQL